MNLQNIIKHAKKPMVIFIKKSDEIKYKGEEFNGKQSDVITYTCYFCENIVSGIITSMYTLDERLFDIDMDMNIKWLLCPNCSHGSLLDRDGSIYPSATKTEKIKGLDNIVQNAYDEACVCFSTRCYVACELLCQKIIMHVAFELGAKKEELFEHCLDYLKDQDHTTPQMMPWIVKIKQYENDTTHRIQNPNKYRAENMLTFTSILLKIIYEIKYHVTKYVKEQSDEKNTAFL